MDCGMSEFSGLEPVVKQARGLSSGTLSYLCGSTLYSVVDQVRADFLDFCIECESQFATWQQAWQAYAKVKGYHVTE
jgi:hypothetical protein